MNTGDVIVLIVVLGCVLLAAGILRHNRKNGRRSCGCRCPGCSGSCGKK